MYKRLKVKNIKFCPKCGEEKEVVLFGRDASRLDGRYTYCKQCRLTPRKGEAEMLELAKKQLKKCTKCEIVKPFSAFDSDASKRFGVTSSCKKCHRESRRQRTQDWHMKKQELEYLAVMGKSICTKCNSVKRFSEFLSSRKNKMGIFRLCKSCNNEYRSRRLPSKRDYIRWDIFERDDFTCYLCEEILDPRLRHPNPKSLSIDHVVPIAKDGQDDESNVRTACLKCNLDKRDRMLEDYLDSLSL